jgi:hypothetical protein
MNQYQYGQANSWLLISSSFFLLETLNLHSNIYFHHVSTVLNNETKDMHAYDYVSFYFEPWIDISS